MIDRKSRDLSGNRILGAAALGAALLFTAAPVASEPSEADFHAALQALDTKKFQQKAQAIEHLGTLGDPRVLEVLESLAKGRLYVRKDGRVVIAERSGKKYIVQDAVSGRPKPEASKKELKKIKVNNRLRRLIRGVTGQLALFSDDPDRRIKAADNLSKNPNPQILTLFRQARDRETDDAVRAKLEVGIAMLELEADDPALRLAATATLAETSDPDIRSLLERRLQTDAEPNLEIRDALHGAIETIDRKLWLFGIAENLLFGISLGSVLLLAAIGLAITFGVMGVINMAHGEMIMLGAYSAFMVQEIFRSVVPPELFGFYLLAALPVAFLMSASMGVLIERGVIRFLYGRPLETLLATWGISLILQQLVRSIFGANNREVANPEWISGAIEIAGGVTVTLNRLCIILFSLAVVAALAAFIRYSRFGLNMRAVTQNRSMAASMGIRTGQVDALTFALGSGIAGVAGMALSQISNVSPNLGQNFIVDSFMVVVFGGVGSLWGTIVGAFSLGIVNKFLEPVSGAILGKIVVLIFIILFIQMRPRGLFALKGRAAGD
ncbi:MAG: urea ABC transporter permease subunit UrtB [Gammaproteobacteria bacterium]|nr:urea ABC transporter permease subunit UrtB [Gammaproteobacteria bacterium]